MSSILKALKRLEHENAARKPSSLKIDAEILKSGSSSRRLFSMGTIMASVAIFAFGGGAVYFYLKHDTTASVSVKPPALAVTTAPTTGQPAVTVVQQVQSVDQAAGQQTILSKTLHPAVERPVHPLQPIAKQQQSRFEKTAEIAPQLSQTSKSNPVSTPAFAVVVPPIKTTLKIDGIAYQDGGNDSLAVVNGTAVSKGSAIEGAVVEEILKDRVRFSRGGEKFDIILDKLN